MRKQLSNSLYFQVVMIVITFITSCAYLRVMLGSISYIGLVIGFVICLCSLFDGTFRRVIAEKTSLLLMAFCGFYLITIVLSRQSQFITNIKQWIYLCVFLYVLTAITGVRTREQRKNALRIVSYVYCILSFVVALISFYMFLTEFSYYAQDPNTKLGYEMGIMYKRLAGLYNPNTSASIFSGSIITSIFLFVDANRGDNKFIVFKKAFCIINVVLQFCCLVLTSSRGGIYSFFVAIFVLTFFLMNKRFEKYDGIKKVVVVFISSILMVALVVGAEKVFRLGLEYVPGFINTPTETASLVGGPIRLDVEKIDLDREYNTISTGRVEIWKSSMLIIKDNFLFGIPYESLYELASPYLIENGVSTHYLNAGGTFHNIIISCLVSSGIVGFIPMVTFIIVKLSGAIKFAFKEKEYQLIELLPLVVVLMALANEMVESRILYSVNILNVVFWTMMGYLPSYKKVTNET